MSIEVIRGCCRTLRCAHIRNNIEGLLLDVAVEGWSVEQVLDEIMARKCEALLQDDVWRVLDGASSYWSDAQGKEAFGPRVRTQGFQRRVRRQSGHGQDRAHHCHRRVCV